LTRAYYSAVVSDFLTQPIESIRDALAQQHTFALEDLQKHAWTTQVQILRQCLLDLAEGGYLLLEFSIPRMGKRVDVILLAHGIVFVLEFKIGEQHYPAHALDQVLDYALDLKNFHAGSHARPIIPILVATNAAPYANAPRAFDDQVFAPLRANRDTLGPLLSQLTADFAAPHFDPVAWRDAPYHPTPTIVEAAQALYRGHNVSEISRSDAGAINLSHTTAAIADIIQTTKTAGEKTICFITGVPGAGKTLAGLNLANERLRDDRGEPAVFLSGNGPLVTVLREALARDEHSRWQPLGQRLTKKAALTRAQTFIQNIHHFRDEALTSTHPPRERVAIFDEAQRAWTQHKTADFMQRKRNHPDFSMSEPEFLISIMERHPGWAVIICLIGGGQEIHTGEAGLLEWFRVLRTRFGHWRVYCSPNLADEEYLRGDPVEAHVAPHQLTLEPRLHLAVSVRSYRTEHVSAFVKALLDNAPEVAHGLLRQIAVSYPLVLTRDLQQAKHWLRSRARASERYGLLASSGALRVRAIGLNVRADIDVANWFLADKDDVRSSYYLEEAATEFDIQGLELDWTCVVWDADLRHTERGWRFHEFVGAKWRSIADTTRQRYLLNAYRVLLTRARQGMVVVVPPGDSSDPTRPSEYYDGTYHFLSQLGLRQF
jgi:hypothetical protein